MRCRPSYLCALALLAVAPALKAAPDAAPSQGDAILQMLQSKGLMPGSEDTTAFVRQVRDRASDLVMSAMNFLGVPYRRGGNNENGFDCSGFTRHVFEMSLGKVLPRRADQQAADPSMTDVSKDELKPGDLVFFNTMRRAFSHVGIYVGDGKFIHSPATGGKVRIEDMRQAYWAQRFNGARRAEVSALPAAEAPPRR